MSIGPRNYIIEGQVIIEQAPNVADAQATAEAAVAAISTALAALGAGQAVQFSVERENGAFVFSQQ